MRLLFLAIALMATGAASTGQRQRFLLDEIETSKDIARLERLAADVDYSDREYDAKQDPFTGPKVARSAAYVRLGQLATRESLAAINRIESRLRHRSTLPPFVRENGWLPNPVSHIGDSHWGSFAETIGTDGNNYALISDAFYGGWSLFLCRFDTKSQKWSRPWLVPAAVDPWTDATLQPAGVDLLEARFRATRDTQVTPPPVLTLDIAKLIADTDGDGWTDIEESRLGLDARSRDSDRDGIHDGIDPMPLFPRPKRATSDDDQILRRAIFATFGLSGAPDALFVSPQATRVHVESNAGPMLYAEPPASPPAISIGWRIVEKTNSTAIVEIVDYEGQCRRVASTSLSSANAASGWSSA